MARGDTEFCRVEVDFILDDPRYLSLSPSARCVFMWLWARAVKDRSEYIHEAFNDKQIAASVRLRTDRTRAATQECAAIGLIEISADNRIKVCGVRSKHRKLRGWDGVDSDPYGDDTGPIKNHISGSKRESKRESERKSKKTNKERKRFRKPTLDEVTAYIAEIGSAIDPQGFIDSNEAKGWLVGTTKTPMKDWKAVVRTWERNRNDRGRKGTGKIRTQTERSGDRKEERPKPGEYLYPVYDETQDDDTGGNSSTGT